ncbi:cell wall-binding repeat-containing protein [Romboutsia sedimentorum]|uniref:Cell wall-binding repeat-containing protein n=1 Tax=Romboutsia sedimentorum TaxID=1368474 RepID=A0ABT7E7S3_9FIRM|nr:cell wall-binding repeat-containing protein [Romboutsia sedimentorum]MDK2562974.1 cell wall-binding repeat-containing protein [Romboutsia sedimentorum]
MIKKITTILSISLLCFTSTKLDIYANEKYNRNVIKGTPMEISMELNKSAFKKSKEAILINEEALVDGVSTTPLAYAKNAPIIAVKWKSIDKETKNYLKTLGVEKITIIGGLKNVSKTSEMYLKDLGYEVKRISGDNRYKTCIKLANEMNKINKVKSVMLLNSKSGFENALGVYSYAAQNNMPIIWCDDEDFSLSKSYIKKNKIEKVFTIGDKQKYTDVIEKNIRNVKVLEEANKADANIGIIKELQKNKFNSMYTVNLEYGNHSQSIECISLGVVAAKQNIPILIGDEMLNKPQEKFLDDNNVDTLNQVGSNIKDYSMLDTIMSKSFLSSILLILLLTIMVFRSFRNKA